jgi:HEPN domain-containing protein
MPLDRVLLAETRAWLVKAANDLRGASVDVNASPPLLEDAMFHCQQAVEKSLKAFLTFHNIPFRKTHNLEELGEVCLQIDRSLFESIDEAVPLTEFAWSYRYPGDPETPTSDEAKTAIATAARVFDDILKRIPPEARP